MAKTIDQLTVTICAELCRHCEAVLAKLKRPPLAWDSLTDKPLKFKWAIYHNGTIVAGDIIAYDVEAPHYYWSDGLATHLVKEPFIVKRLD